jgi:hypothetical protein
MNWSDADGSTGVSRTEKDAHGNVTGGSGEMASANGDIVTSEYKRDPKTGEVQHSRVRTYPDGSGVRYTERRRGTPSETPYSGRGGFDEAWMDKSLPWFMDTIYVQWKRESDLVQSGGRIAQPGRGENPSPGTSDGPRVGTNAVVNCGDSATNPCARYEGTTIDTQGGLGDISQPPRGVPGGGPGGMGGPPPLPIPPPKQ